MLIRAGLLGVVTCVGFVLGGPHFFDVKLFYISGGHYVAGRYEKGWIHVRLV